MHLLHGIGSRQDLPLPFEYVVIGGAITLLITFAVLLFAWREPRLQELSGKPLPRLTAFTDHKVVDWTLRLIVGAVWLIAAAALVAGQDRLDNPVFGFVFVWVWVGLVPISLLFGRVWRRTNPIRTLLVGAGAVRANPVVGKSVLPAAIALFAFSFFELVQPDRTTIPVLRGWTALWLAWLLVGVAVAGQSWIASADPFEAFATTVARFSIWARNSAKQIVVTNPLRNLASWRPPKHLSALVVVLLGGTAYDSFSNGLFWVQFTQNSSIPRWIWGTIGLLTMVVIVGGTYLLGAAGTRIQAKSWREQADLLAPGLVPIVVGYALAHYGTLLWLEGQRTAIYFSDPLGRGWNLFGTAELGVNTAIIGYSSAIALVQVLCIVGGHVCGVIVSHDISIRHLEDDGARFGRQVTGQLPLLLVMVGYTVGGLVLLFA